MHACVNGVERRRATDVQPVSLLAAEGQIGDGLWNVDLTKQLASWRIAANAILFRIAPSDGAPDAAIPIGAHSIGDARFLYLHKDLAVRQPENWVLLQVIYADELARFRSPVPALRVVRDKLKRQSHRYFDRDGVRHENDLSDDFIDQAEFHLDDSSATWSGGVVLSKDTLFYKLSPSNEFGGEYIGDKQAAEAPSKQPSPICRTWHVDPFDPRCAVSYEERVHRWEAYAIELAPAVVTSAPAPLPKRLSSKGVLTEEINRRKAAGEKLPRRSDLAHDLAKWMMARAQSGNDIKPLRWRTIANYLSKLDCDLPV